VANQHYVPKFYFRQFNGGGRRIHVLIMKDGHVVLNAPIKNQCCDGRLYGSDQVEAAISRLEERHAAAMGRAINMAWSGVPTNLSTNEHVQLLEAVLFQNARTMLEVHKMSSAREALALEMFAKYVSQRDPQFHARLIDDIARGKIRVTESPRAVIKQAITIALKSTILVCDLDLYLVRNLTDYPFIFSDSPVVLYNMYYRDVKNRGVLGLQTPGLQIFVPLNSRTLLLLIDSKVYAGSFKGRRIFDITNRYDVSQLNALQLHHSLQAVYFIDDNTADYLEDLWRLHKPTITQPAAHFVRREGWLLNGRPVDELFQMFQPQLNLNLRLSFIDCTPIREKDFTFRRRTPELVAEQDRELGKNRAPVVHDSCS
jgi:hypothetical protein